jgi:hypothetical protein
VVTDGHLVGTVAGGQAEDEREVPNAYAHLHAVGIGLPVVGGLDDIHLGLLRGRRHSSYSLQGRDGMRSCSLDGAGLPGSSFRGHWLTKIFDMIYLDLRRILHPIYTVGATKMKSD